MKFRINKIQPKSHYNFNAESQDLEESNALSDFGRVSIASLFKIIEANKIQFKIKDYSLSETTLEQIFFHFASKQ